MFFVGSDPSKWSCERVPTDQDAVEIANATVTLDQAAHVASLLLTGSSSLSGAFPLTVAGQVQMMTDGLITVSTQGSAWGALNVSLGKGRLRNETSASSFAHTPVATRV
ncbi:MAG: hypothetical protein EOM24_04795 [Chloroflexia bacterium]|nr:hypothetical protein [Chloroflexia bacterium]